MRLRQVGIVLSFALLFGLSPTRTDGQIATGTPPFGSYSGGPDVVNLSNLDAHIAIPVLSKTGRGIPFAYNLGYDSSVWYPVGVSGSQSWVPGATWGWQGSATGSISYTRTAATCKPAGEVYTYNDWLYTDPNGTAHPFVGESTYNGCASPPYRGFTAVTKDGSGYTLTTLGPTGTVTSPDGAIITQSGSVQDRNGNEITESSGVYTDTTGNTVLTIAGGTGFPPTPETLSYTAPSGATAKFTINYSQYTVRTNFGCSGISEFGPTTEYLVSSIVLPDSTLYTFSYEATPGYGSDVTGRLKSVTFPTGGEIVYLYLGGNNGITCADGSTATLQRTTPDGTWNYAHVESGASTTTTVTDPYGEQTVIDFFNGYELFRQIFPGSSSGTALAAVSTCYNGVTTQCQNQTNATPPITQITQYISWAGPSGMSSETNTLFNSYGFPTEVDEYGYNQDLTFPLVRKTLTTYATLGNGIVDRPAQVTVENGSGNIDSQITYTYDQGSVTATSGTPQHVSISGSRGNATTFSYLVSGSTTLTKTYTYFDTGNVQTATDVNGGQTTSSNFTCGNSFPTSVAEPGGLTESLAWNCTGGVVTSVTDENGQTTSTSFTDPYFWRPNSVKDQLSNVTTFSYTGANSAESSLIFNASASTVDVRTTLDGLGRKRVSQIRESPSSNTYDSVESDYDLLGRLSRTTLPYAGSAGQTNSSAPAITQTYDALGRLILRSDSGGGSVSDTYAQNDSYETAGPAPSGENSKSRQLEYDALGRLTSVCEVTSGGGSGTCSQTNLATGFYTTYAYDALNDLTGVSQNAQASGSVQTRTSSYDDLGRMTSESNPETGTTTYIYDSDATCGSSPGDMVKKVDAALNVICYAYDIRHRVTRIYVASGPYMSVTPQKYFVYDTANVNGVAMTNVTGRLAEAYTCASPCSSKITDEGFSYTPRGELSDIYQSTSHSGGYYHVNQTYWANGETETLSAQYNSLGITGWPNINYGVDGEGRPYSASASSGQNPLASTSYNVASLATQVNLGSLDSDTFTFDPNTNRMTQYQFSVNNQVVSGRLQWNPIGSLASLTITDPFNSSDAQTCSYSHDDLSRIASVNCGSVWSQTFTPDVFGNISKSGTQSFQPSYSYLTNQMTEIGSSVPTYDANGNVTNDFLHTYAWDAADRPVTIDGVGVTYDALGRNVEEDTGGSYTQTIYSPSGAKLAIVSGEALSVAYIPLTGGSVAVYNSGGLAYYRHSDWIGSSRLASTSARSLYFDGAYGPFGEPYAQSGTTDLSFTGMNQDTAVNLYDFPARDYGIQGRWPSPDPAGLSASDLSDPQTLNRYAYVRNSPLTQIDPLGLCNVHPRGSPCRGLRSQPGSTTDEFSMFFNQIWAFTGYYVQGAGYLNTLSLDDLSYLLNYYPDIFGVSQTFDPEGLNLAILEPTGLQVAGGSGTVPQQSRRTQTIGPDPHSTRSRIQCAANYADQNSLASHVAAGGNAGQGGPAPNFLENLFLGNTFSAGTHLYMFAAGAEDPSLSDAGTVILSGGGQGLPGGGPGFKGAVGVIQDAVLGELGGQGALDFGTGFGYAKLAYDFVSFAYGYYVCK